MISIVLCTAVVVFSRAFDPNDETLQVAVMYVLVLVVSFFIGRTYRARTELHIIF